MLSHLTTLMPKWANIPLGWIEQVTVVKRSILVKLLYLFRVLPIPVPSHYLWILQRQVSLFIWCVHRPYLSLISLSMPSTPLNLQMAQLLKYATKNK